MEFSSGDATITINQASGVLERIELLASEQSLLLGDRGLFDLALPLPDLPSYRLRISAAQRTVDWKQTADEIHWRYDSLRCDRGEFPINATVTMRALSEGGFAMRLTIVNHSPDTIPQVLFPNLHGLQPTGLDANSETLHLGRSIKYPYAQMKTEDKAVEFFDLYRHWYFPYGMQDWNLRWMRLGNRDRGVVLYSKSTDLSLAGLYVERQPGENRLRLAWVHYPHIGPGETWVSPDIIIWPHRGDWPAGALPYRSHVAANLPTVPTTKYLHDSLGVRTLFFSTYLFDDEPNYTFKDLPVVARDAVDHGIHELNLWFAFKEYFELPIKLNSKLGDAAALKRAISECRAMGVNVSAFLSVRALKTRTTPAEWFEQDDGGNRRTQSYSYSLGFVPPFNPAYWNRQQSAFVCPTVAAYRQAFLSACQELNQLGFSSISFDQLFVANSCYVKEHGHKPQELLGPLYEMVQSAHRQGQAIDSDASLSGEFFNDISQTFQHYHWDWINGSAGLDQLEAFRFIFPRFRLSLLVDRGKRWLLEGFARGFLLNFLPDGAEGLIRGDKEFSELVKKLAIARKTYSRFFEEGEYLGSRPVPKVNQGLSSAYRHGDQWLLILTNLTDKDAQVGGAVHAVAGSPIIGTTVVPPSSVMFFLWQSGDAEWASA
jgi:hypothetical protein